MRKILRPLAVLLVIANLLLTPFSTFAASGTSGVSASDNALLKKWKQLGLLDNGVNASELYKPIQKIDFIGFVNDVLKPSKLADINFIDVPKDSWYGKEIAKAVAAGYVVNDGKKNFQPFSYITRVEAAVMVAKVFGLELSDQKLLKKITDAEKLDPEQLQAFGTVIEKGYLSEISSGRYAPLGVLKLVDAMKMLDKCIGLVITQSGTVTKNVTGNMIINKNSVNLKNMEISGDLIIGEGVADGNVTLENVTIKGKLIIRGGGQNGVIIKSSSIKGDVIVEKYAGNIYVVAQGTTTIENTHLRSGGTLFESNLTTGKGFVNVIAEQAVAANQIANLEGDFDSIQTDKSNINIRLKGKAKNVNILEGTISDFTLVSGSADTIATKTTKSTIQLLSGIVNTLKVETNATGNRIDLNGVAKVGSMNIFDTTSINFEKGNVDTLIIDASSGSTYLSMKENAYIKNIVANAAATITGTGNIENMYVYADDVKVEITPKSVYIANGVASDVNGTIIDTTKPTVSFSVPNQIGMMVKDTKQINVSGLSPSKTKLTYISSDNTIATVSDDGVITGVSIGTTKIYVTGQYSNFNSKTATINLTVASDNVTAPGTLEITPESGEAGTKADFVLTYTAGDNMTNGTVVIKLPSGFMALESDTVSIDGSEEKALTAAQRPNSQTLSFTNLDLKENSGKIVVKLKNKVIPNDGDYIFTAIADADGAGPALPTVGNEKAVFSVDKLKKLKLNINYWTPIEGSKGGTIRIPKLSTAGIISNTNLKWMIKVQDYEFTSQPKFNDVLSITEYTEYKQGQDIAVTAEQKLRLVVVDKSTNEVKAYSDLTIDGKWIRQYDADELELNVNYSGPKQGIKAGTVRITDLKFTNLDASANNWMIKVTSTKPSSIFVDSNIGDTAVYYVDGEDISVYEGQYIILVAVNSAKRVKAYTVIQVNRDMISKKAGDLKPISNLQTQGNYSIPSYGTQAGTTQIKSFNIGSFNITNWLYVVLDKNDVITIPALNASVNEYTKYLGKDSLGINRSFTKYTEGNIPAVAGQHILLVGVNDSYEIQAYADIALNSSNIR